MENYRYLIIGNSTGGIGAVEGIRAVDPEGPIAVIGEESGPALERHALHVVVGMGSGKLGVRGAVAGLAHQAA
ncbi:MAG: hypothetical protein NT056_11045, partial [Proteobacteria bacterium]|nr:hypothetical protein [Pseudomonadota bacterium]